jgi:hypothetical protein
VREREREMTIDKNNQGAWRISAFVGEGGREGEREYLLTRTYYFMTKREAISQFKREREGANK